MSKQMIVVRKKTNKNKNKNNVNNQVYNVSNREKAYLGRIFADSQNWNANSERPPRFDQVNLRDNKVYTIVQQTVNRAQLVGNGTTPTTLQVFSRISDLPNSSHYLSIFDQYKIAQVEIWLQPGASSNITTSTTVYSVIDYDDANALISESNALEYQNVMFYPENIGHYRRYIPHIATSVYTGVTPFSGFKNTKADWIDSASSTVEHFGFKAYMSAAPATVSFDLLVRQTVQFRNVF